MFNGSKRQFNSIITKIYQIKIKKKNTNCNIVLPTTPWSPGLPTSNIWDQTDTLKIKVSYTYRIRSINTKMRCQVYQ
jgi:hypothetical protein